MRTPESAERDNRTMWDGRRRGFYEMYSLSLLQPETGHGLWVRFLLLASNEPKVKSTGEVWAAFFNAADPSRHLALRAAIPLVEAEISRDSFHLSIGPHWMSVHETRGRIGSNSGTLEWDLQFFSEAPPFRYFPQAWMYRTVFPRTKRLVPQPQALVNGIFQVNGEVFRCQHAPGIQEHVWGSQPPHRWIQAEAVSFADAAESELRAYSSETLLAGLDLPRATMIRLKYRGEEIRLNSVLGWFTQHSRFEPFFWYFVGHQGKRDFVGELSVAASDVVGIQFKDPQGHHVFYYSSNLADLILKVFERQGGKFVKVDELKSPHRTLFEYAQRTPVPGAPMYFAGSGIPADDATLQKRQFN